MDVKVSDFTGPQTMGSCWSPTSRNQLRVQKLIASCHNASASALFSFRTTGDRMLTPKLPLAANEIVIVDNLDILLSVGEGVTVEYPGDGYIHTAVYGEVL
jgi:hypothetical protein